MRLTHIAAALLLASATTALAHQTETGELLLVHPFVVVPAEGATDTSAYVSIQNEGDHPDRLTGVETAGAGGAMLVGADGAALEGIDIPAGGTVDLTADGMHIMLHGLTGSLQLGDVVPATLIFEHSGRVDVGLEVDEPGTVAHDAAPEGEAAPAN